MFSTTSATSVLHCDVECFDCYGRKHKRCIFPILPVNAPRSYHKGVIEWERNNRSSKLYNQLYNTVVKQRTFTGSVGSSFSRESPWWKRNITGGSLTGCMLMMIVSVVLAGGMSGSRCSSYIVMLIYSIPEQSWHGLYTKLKNKETKWIESFLKSLQLNFEICNGYQD